MSHTVHDQAISLRVTREMPATPEEVFAAYTEPEAQRLWLTQRGPDEGEVRTAVDLRVGGVWEATFHPNPAVLVHDIFTFVEIDRPHRVVTRYTGESTVEGRVTASPETLIVLRLAPTDAGTLVTVEQTGFPDTPTRDFFETVAWPGALDRIAAYLAGRRSV